MICSHAFFLPETRKSVRNGITDIQSPSYTDIPSFYRPSRSLPLPLFPRDQKRKSPQIGEFSHPPHPLFLTIASHHPPKHTATQISPPSHFCLLFTQKTTRIQPHPLFRSSPPPQPTGHYLSSTPSLSTSKALSLSCSSFVSSFVSVRSKLR